MHEYGKIHLMNILALDTSTELLSLALLQGSLEQGFNTTERVIEAGQTHSQRILLLLQEVLEEANIMMGVMDAIAFGAGPGSFTGLRIACGVAQGLAFGAACPLIPVGTLLAMAEASGHSRVITCLDARMSEVYHAAYEKQADQWYEVCAPNLSKPDHVPLVDGNDWFGVGSGWNVAKDTLMARYEGRLLGVDSTVVPHARVMAKLAVDKFLQGETVSPALASPIYVRNKVALTTQERAIKQG